MALEIERKFLVRSDDWRSLATGVRYCQGYLAVGKTTVRVRVAGEQAYLTIKGPTAEFTRSEYEYAIPLADAVEMLHTLCQRPLIDKQRYKIEWEGLLWEVDEFGGENQGLLVAEVELTDANQTVALPPWIGQEVTGDPRYYNSNLVQHPFSQWGESF
jgi:adenylate cyclase